MSKSIFINSSDVFDVTINYKEDGRKVKILAEPEKDDEGKVTSQSVTITFRFPNFSDSQQVLRAATSTDSNGQPSLNFLQLQTSLLYSLAYKWDAKDEKGQPVELNAQNLSKLRVDIAKAAIEAVYKELGDGGLI